MDAKETAVRIVVDLLVRSEFEAVESLDRGGRLSAGEMRRAVAYYGRTLAEPGDDWWGSVEIMPIRDRPAFHVAAPMWTEEEGRSDLTLELRLVEMEPGDVYQTEIHGLHVL